MKYGIVVVPAAPVRKKPRHKFEMTNQLLFGEKVIILVIKNKEWYKVKSLYDGYKGWVTHHMIHEIDRDTFKNETVATTGDLLNRITIDQQPMHIPFGSFLWSCENGTGQIGNMSYRYEGALAHRGLEAAGKRKTIEKEAKAWLNAPYLWGGKTILGVDCSGFAQTIFKVAGIVLQRDAWQQAQQGSLIKRLQDAQAGDLAFFDDKDEIVHVGILLGPDAIIHSSGKVRIDRMDKKGIINTESGKRTHRLKLIKRMPELS